MLSICRPFPRPTLAIMFRSLLELSVAYYLDRTGRLKQIIASERKRRNGHLRRDWSPTLKMMLKFIANDNTIELNPQVLRALNQFISDGSSQQTRLDPVLSRESGIRVSGLPS